MLRPVNRSTTAPIMQIDLQASTMDREYDFTGVVEWYADRADVVFLFFDPDKPGTTGETLSTTTSSVTSSTISQYGSSNASSETMSDGGSLSIHPMIVTT